MKKFVTVVLCGLLTIFTVFAFVITAASFTYGFNPDLVTLAHFCRGWGAAMVVGCILTALFEE
jgi:hypothetical protein